MDKDIEKFMKRIIAIFMVLALVLSCECMAAARQEKAPPGDKPAENSQPKSENQAAALKAAENALDKKDFARAADILKDLAKSGNPEALYFLGRLTRDGLGVKKNVQQAARYFSQAAEKGDVSAQNAWGCALAQGQGVRRNYKEAARWLRKAAEPGPGLVWTRGKPGAG